jgi:hypothetical protein
MYFIDCNIGVHMRMLSCNIYEDKQPVGGVELCET